MKSNRYIYILLLFFVTALFSLPGHAKESESKKKEERTPKPKRLEVLGDRAFISGHYDDATAQYEKLLQHLEKNDASEKIRKQLKLARVYNMLQDYEKAALHYRSVLDQGEHLLEVDDVCSYIDALLRLDNPREAEIVARHFAYKSPHSRNQRYINSLNAVSSIHYYHGVGESDFGVELLDISGEDAEYWVTRWDGTLFVATSASNMLDPRKIFFHQTNFSQLTEKRGEEVLVGSRLMPRELQNGPSATSGDMWVITRIAYRKAARILGVEFDKRAFQTNLYYTYNKTKFRWTSPAPLFEKQGETCYAHPVFLDGGRTLLFSSDMEGGYGGMDLYITRWNEAEKKWSAPINLGSSVNTEGDEIYPFVADNILYFSSNGHEGYGGYDLYSVDFVNSKVVPSSRYHYPYPINTVYNDYGLYQSDDTTSYFISDRRGLGYRDDIYTFRNVRTSLTSTEVMGVSQEYLALTGKFEQVNDLSSNVAAETKNVDLVESDFVVIPREGNVLYTIYYGFDKWNLPGGATIGLDALIHDEGLESVSELLVLGYADELGTDSYNEWISKQRARLVAEYLVANGIKSKVTWQGKGKISPDTADYHRQLQNHRWYDSNDTNPEVRYQRKEKMSLNALIELNRTARKVEVVVKKK